MKYDGHHYHIQIKWKKILSKCSDVENLSLNWCLFFVTWTWIELRWTATHWLRYSEKIRLGEVPGIVVMPPMFDEYAMPMDMALHIIRSCFLLFIASCIGTAAWKQQWDSNTSLEKQQKYTHYLLTDKTLIDYDLHNKQNFGFFHVLQLIFIKQRTYSDDWILHSEHRRPTESFSYNSTENVIINTKTQVVQ